MECQAVHFPCFMAKQFYPTNAFTVFQFLILLYLWYIAVQHLCKSGMQMFKLVNLLFRSTCEIRARRTERQFEFPQSSAFQAAVPQGRMSWLRDICVGDRLSDKIFITNDTKATRRAHPSCIEYPKSRLSEFHRSHISFLISAKC